MAISGVALNFPENFVISGINPELPPALPSLSPRDQELQQKITDSNSQPAAQNNLSERQIEVLRESPLSDFTSLIERQSCKSCLKSASCHSFNPSKIGWEKAIIEEAMSSPFNVGCVKWEGKVKFNLPSHLAYDEGVCLYFHWVDLVHGGAHHSRKYMYFPMGHPLKPLADLFCAIESDIIVTEDLSKEGLELFEQALKTLRKALPKLFESFNQRFERFDPKKQSIKEYSAKFEEYNDLNQVLLVINAVYGELRVRIQPSKDAEIPVLVILDEIIQIEHEVFHFYRNVFISPENAKLPMIDEIFRILTKNFFLIYDQKVRNDLQTCNILEMQRTLLYTDIPFENESLKFYRSLVSMFISFYYNNEEGLKKINSYLYDQIGKLQEINKTYASVYGPHHLSKFPFLNFTEHRQNFSKEYKPLKVKEDKFQANYNAYIIADYALSVLEIAVNDNRDQMFELFDTIEELLDNYLIHYSYLINDELDWYEIKLEKIYFNSCGKKFLEIKQKCYQSYREKMEAVVESCRLELAKHEVHGISVMIEDNSLKFSSEFRSDVDFLMEKFELNDFQVVRKDLVLMIPIGRNVKLESAKILDLFASLAEKLSYSRHRAGWNVNLQSKYSENLKRKKFNFKLNETIPRLDVIVEGMPCTHRKMLIQSFKQVLGNVSEKSEFFSLPLTLEDLKATSGNFLEFLEDVDSFFKSLNQTRPNSKTKSKSSGKKVAVRKTGQQNLSQVYLVTETKIPRNPASIRRKDREGSAKVETSKTLSPQREIPKERFEWSHSGRFYEENHPDSVHRLHNKNCPDTFYAYLDPSIPGEKTLVDKFGELLPTARYKRRGVGIKLVKRSETKNRNIPSEYTHKLKIKGDARVYGKEIEVIDVKGNKKVLIVFDKLIEKTHFR